MSKRLREHLSSSVHTPREALILSIRSSLLISLLLMLSSCLPIEVEQPECYPEEGCGAYLQCVEGRCVTPASRELVVSASCLGGLGCQERLRELQLTEACLILEQPSALHTISLNFTQLLEGESALSLPLLNSPAKPSIILLKKNEVDSSSLNGEENEREVSICNDSSIIHSRGLDRTCVHEEGCLLRLRASLISAEQLLANPSIKINFDGPDGQCVESVWGGEEQAERCDGKDWDCDGFIDEGLSCGGGE